MDSPAAAEEHRNDAATGGEEVVYKTKTIEFLGRSTPIILQNDNGPCPLLAICNVLLLRNSLNLGGDAPEVPLHKLLSLVAEKLLDSNSNIKDKDDEYVSNQQQNIADAIDLLPRLATGIDVNVQFRKINDFEFTRECAIFDLLDIELYHGWIVDPQDTDTAAAIGSKSYNALVAELVAFETGTPDGGDKSNTEEDCVDFAAATTAALGVPSPSLSKGRSFDGSPVALPADQLKGKGDREEEAELMKALSLSRADTPNLVNVSMSSNVDCGDSCLNPELATQTKSAGSGTNMEPILVQLGDESEKAHQQQYLFESQECNGSSDIKSDASYSKAFSTENDTKCGSISPEGDIIQSVPKDSGSPLVSIGPVKNLNSDILILDQATTCQYIEADVSKEGSTYKDPTVSTEESIVKIQTADDSTSQDQCKSTDDMIDYNSNSSDLLAAPFHSSNERRELPDTSQGVTSGVESSDPMYEGEERILDSGLPIYEVREPIYEGEMVLAEQANKVEDVECSVNSEQDVHKKWQLIKSFLLNSASQLTVYGLFCLQEGLKERELCVFFRNNHFSTMFKFNGELYLLATDQGYINQPNLVWEKLNEVNGNTVFMTGNFTEFKAENPSNDSWNEQNAMTTTADYLATLEGSSPSSSMNSDLQLAIALQQQEFDQQPQRQQKETPQQSQQQPVVSGRSRLVTGSQVPRTSNIPQKSESKSKDKCIVM